MVPPPKKGSGKGSGKRRGRKEEPDRDSGEETTDYELGEDFLADLRNEDEEAGDEEEQTLVARGGQRLGEARERITSGFQAVSGERITSGFKALGRHVRFPLW